MSILPTNIDMTEFVRNNGKVAGEKVEAALAVLQPLRDLARNFDIDIASCLEEYVDELVVSNSEAGAEAQAVISAAAASLCNEDGKSFNVKPTPNFAQAALLIQNSSSVYSRKVEYLHSLVYAALNDLIRSTVGNASSNGKKRAGNGSSNDAAIDEFNSFDPEMQFLLMNEDVLPIDKTARGRKINLLEEEDFREDLNATQLNAPNTTIATNVDGASPDVTMLSLGGVLSATRMDQSGTFFVNDRESLGNENNSAISRILSSCLQVASDAGEGNLRLLSGMCDVGGNGTLILPGSSLFSSGATDVSKSHENLIFPGGLSPINDASGAIVQANDDDPWATSFQDDGCDGEYSDGHGIRLDMNNECSDLYELSEDEKKENETLHASKVDVDEVSPTIKLDVDDPWAILDPHMPSDDKERPLRIGNTYRLPPGLDKDDRPSRAVTGSRTKAKKIKKQVIDDDKEKSLDDLKCPPFLADVTFDNTLNGNDAEAELMDGGDTADQNQNEFHVKILKSKQLIFGEEFAYIAKAHAKQKEVLRRQRRLEQQNLQTSHGNVQADIQNGPLPNNFDGENTYHGDGIDFGDADDDSYGSNGGPEMGCGNDLVHSSNVDFNAIDDAFTYAGLDGHEGDCDDMDATGQETFEELCRAHLRKFAKSAEIYAAETQLTKRVGAWQTGLAPVLREQEERPEFDIHKYSRRIIKSVENNLPTKKRSLNGEKKLEKSCNQKHVVDFQTIAKGSDDYEVCRLFLSTLTLCNSGNVAVHMERNNTNSVSLDSFQLELLDPSFEVCMDSFLDSDPLVALDDENKSSSTSNMVNGDQLILNG